MRSPLATLGLSALLLAPAAGADDLVGTRYDIRESSCEVEVRVDRGSATLVVTRTVANPGPRSDQALFHLSMPPGAVATRLRTAGIGANGERVWFEGDLMEAEAAAAKYQELTGIGGYYPKDPALLSWRSQERLALQVFPVPGAGTKAVEYTLKIPLRYEGGLYKGELPALGAGPVAARLRFAPAHAEDALRINGVSVTHEASITGSRALELELVPRATVVDGRVASVALGKDRVLVHTRIDAPPRLGAAPASAAVALVIDTSRSMSEELPSALAAARAYLSYFPDAEVEIVSFARRPTTPFSHALDARAAEAKLYGWQPLLGNGSRLDDALRHADRLLSASKRPARRILLLTDLRTRKSLKPADVAQLSPGTVLHVATVHEGEATLERDDEGDWASVPRRTGGLLWRATVPQGVDAAARGVFEEWVRPKRLDKLVVKGMPADFTAPDVLAEGAGLEHLGIARAGVSRVRLEGELWSRPVRLSFDPSEAEGKLWSALVFGSSLLPELSESEMMHLAMNGRAVSPVTSYLAIEPGVRPSIEGLDALEGIGEGGGGIGDGLGLGGIGTLGHAAGTYFDHAAELRKALEAAMRACAVSAGEATVELETTSDELVEVGAVVLAPARDARAEVCIAESLWRLELPAAFVGDETWTVKAKL